MEDEALNLIAELEEKRGGKITWRTVVLFYADSEGVSKESVFMYRIGDTFFCEDFERNFTFLGFKVKPPKGYKYVKFESSFEINDIKSVDTVLKKDVLSLCNGKTNCRIRKAGCLSSVFRQTLTELEFTDGRKVFMEMLKSAEFKKIIDTENRKR